MSSTKPSHRHRSRPSKTGPCITWSVAALLGLATLSQASEEDELLAVLQSKASVGEKGLACLKLRTIGTEESIPVLAAQLANTRLSQVALTALENLPYPEASAALRETLGQTSGSVRLEVIHALGRRRDTQAVPLLLPLLDAPDSDPMLVTTTGIALGQIGDARAARPLAEARRRAETPESTTALDRALLTLGDRLSKTSPDQSEECYLFVAMQESQYAHAGWAALVRASDAEARSPDLVEGLSSPDEGMRLAASALIRSETEPPVLHAAAKAWAQLADPTCRVAVLDIAHRLGENDALSLLENASKDSNASVRTAAWTACGELNLPQTIPLLAKAAAETEDTFEREAAISALKHVHADGASEILMATLKAASSGEKAVVLTALGQRGDNAASDTLLAYALHNREARSVRLAALEALQALAPNTALRPLLAAAINDAAQAYHASIRRALLHICEKGKDKIQMSGAVIVAYRAASLERRRPLLRLLASLGTEKALAATVSAAGQEGLQEEAIRTLELWPNAQAVPPLLQMAADAEDGSHVTALRAAIDLFPREPEVVKRLGWLQGALELARRPEEQKQALSQLGQHRSAEALTTALAEIPNSEVVDEACLAAIGIAKHLVDSHPELVTKTVQEIQQHCEDQDILDQAARLRSKGSL